MAFSRKRSYSIDFTLPAVPTDDALSELENEVAHTLRERSKKRRCSIPVYIQESSWFSRWCALSRPQWRRKFLLFTQDRLILCTTPKHPYGPQFALSQLNVQFSKVRGHNNADLCLKLADHSQTVEVSFESKEDLEHWLITYNQTTQ